MNTNAPSGQSELEKKASNKQRIILLKALNIATEFGFIIALPLIAFGYAGKKVDQRYHTEYFVLIGVLLAIFMSTFWLSKRIKDILKDLKNTN